MQRYEKSFATGLQRDAFLGEHQRLEKCLSLKKVDSLNLKQWVVTFFKGKSI